MRSFMRFRQRRNVDLPQPEGPISASTERSLMSTEMSNRACLEPYQKLSARTVSLFRALRTATSRPDSERSLMMASYGNRVKGHLSVSAVMLRACGKRGQAPFARRARRVLRTNGACPLFPQASVRLAGEQDP